MPGKTPITLFSQPPCKQILTGLSTNFVPFSHFFAFLKIFCSLDTRFDGHNAAAIIRE
jgi:hypothetical protein